MVKQAGLNVEIIFGGEQGREPVCRLYKNNRDETFTDVTQKSGQSRSGWGQGCCVGNYIDFAPVTTSTRPTPAVTSSPMAPSSAWLWAEHPASWNSLSAFSSIDPALKYFNRGSEEQAQIPRLRCASLWTTASR